MKLNNFTKNKSYIAGIVQADGNFSVSVRRKDDNIWLVPKFNLTLHEDNINVIKGIKNNFNVGHYRIDNDGICRYDVSQIDDLINVIIPFFLKNQLRGDKYISFIMFKIICDKIYNKEHYLVNKVIIDNNTKHNIVLLHLINMAYKINKLSNNRTIKSKEELLKYLNEYERNIVTSKELIYQDILDQELIKYPNNQNINIDFIKGLFDGDGNISAYLTKDRLGYLRIRLTFDITQDMYNTSVFEDVKTFFNCGHINDIKDNAYRYDVKSIKDIKNIIIPALNIESNDSEYNVRLYKLWYANEIIKYINNITRIDSEDKLINMLNYMYYVHNNVDNLTKDEYVNKKFKKYSKYII